jgi:ATP-binding protein involved in chromosome partitioning
VPFLGQVPLVTRVRENADAGVPIVVAEPENPAAQVLQQVADAVVARVCDLGIAAMCEQSPQAVACATA